MTRRARHYGNVRGLDALNMVLVRRGSMDLSAREIASFAASYGLTVEQVEAAILAQRRRRVRG